MNDFKGPDSPPGGLPESPACPFCDGDDTELVNPFGPQLSVSSYWCRRCRSPFEMMKWQGAGARREDRTSLGDELDIL